MHGRREEKKRRTKKAIVDAAIRLFGRKGFDRTSIEELAREAGVGKGTIYGYFKAKDEIFLAFCEEELEYIFSGAVVGRTKDEPFLEQLMNLFINQFRFVTRNRDFGRQLLRELFFPKDLTLEKSRGIEDRYLGSMDRILREAANRGELKPGLDSFVTTAQLYSHYLICLSGWYRGHFQNEEEFAGLLCALLQQAVNGLKSDSETSHA